jgi:hypothetical protein
MTESDPRIRGNMIESLWQGREPEIEVIFESATRDPHHRVAANPVRGLCIMESHKYIAALGRR